MKRTFTIFIMLLIVAGIVWAADDQDEGQASFDPAKDTQEDIFFHSFTALSKYDSGEFTGSLEYLPFWVVPLGENEVAYLRPSLHAEANYEYDDFRATPALNLMFLLDSEFLNESLFGFVFGTGLPIGFEVRQNYFNDDVETDFLLEQYGLVQFTFDHQFASLSAQAEYDVDYQNLPEQSILLDNSAYALIRNSEQDYPYPWTVKFGPEYSYLRVWNDDESMTRTEHELNGRVSFITKAQVGDEFPRNLSPYLGVAFQSLWSEQEGGNFEYDEFNQLKLLVDAGWNLNENTSFDVYSEIPLGDDTETEREEFLLGFMVKVNL